MNWKKRVAKEWLWLTSLLVAILLFWIYNFHGKDIFDFPEVSILSIVFILFVYFVRLTLWAIKELGNNETGYKKKLDWGKTGRFLLYKIILPFTPSEVPWWLSTIGITQTILGYIAIVLGGGFFLTMIYAFFTSSFDWEVLLILIACLFLIVIGIRFLIGGEKISNVKAFEKDSIIDSVEETLNIEDIDTSYDRISCPDENCIGIINPEGICSECGRTPEEIRGGVESKAATPGSYTPLKQKSRWGWGWFVLLSIYATGMQKLSFYVTGTTITISIVGAILLLPFYFWFRNRMIRKKTYGESIWRSSLMAGVISYFLFAILIVVSLEFIGSIQQRSDIEAEMGTFLEELEIKSRQLKQIEDEINRDFISSPASESDIKHNIENLNKSLVLLEKRYILSNSWTNRLKHFSEKKNIKKLKEIVNNYQDVQKKSYLLTRQSIETLIKCYKTGDEKLWNTYEEMLNKLGSLEKEVQEKFKSLMNY